MESTYELRQDVEDCVERLKPGLDADSQPAFYGWSRMAQPILKFAIVEVGRPNVGEARPSSVRADVTIGLGSK